MGAAISALDDSRTISVALGDYPHTAALKSGTKGVAFVDVRPVNRAFAPMARDGRFDVCELAIVTFLQARAMRVPLVLLPAATASRFQEGALIRRAGDTSVAEPGDLRGREVGTRAYAQTTAVWLRGILKEEAGLGPADIRWVTFEDAHVACCPDPSFARRAPQGADMLALLQAGELDAAVVGNDPPKGAEFAPVFPDPQAASQRFLARHGFEPVNHVVVARRDLTERRPEVIAAFLAALARSYRAADRAPALGRAALEPSLDLALRFAATQGALPCPLDPSTIWEGSDPAFDRALSP